MLRSIIINVNIKMSSADDESLFLNIENLCRLEKEIKELKKENELLKQRELDRTRDKPPIEAVVVYLHSSGSYMHCEVSQETQFSSFTKTNGNPGWGNGIKFESIAGMNTQLLRLGFRRLYESKHYHTNTILSTETWVKNMVNY
jgi:hypothetical protein